MDFKQARYNARDALKSLWRSKRMVDRSLINIKSSTITDMPKVPEYGSKTEDAIIQMMDIKTGRDVVLTALMVLSLISCQALYYSSCVPDSLSSYRISCGVGYSEKSVQRMKSEALIEFVEAYKHGRIIAYK